MTTFAETRGADPSVRAASARPLALASAAAGAAFAGAAFALAGALDPGHVRSAAALRRRPETRGLARGAALAAAGSVLLLGWFVSAAYGDLGGLVQRVFVLLAFGLPVTVALRTTSG